MKPKCRRNFRYLNFELMDQNYAVRGVLRTFCQNCKAAQNCIAVISHWTSHGLF